MSSLELLAWLLSAFWFLIYWILGGTIFALISLSRAAQLRAFQFSCFFSLFTLLAALAAGWFGAVGVRAAAPKCLQGVNTVLETARVAVNCAPQPVTYAALIWAGVLFLIGGLVFTLSHRKVVR
jgi:hypothetical protein